MLCTRKEYADGYPAASLPPSRCSVMPILLYALSSNLKAATREVIHEAHAACVAVDPRNADKFKDVLEHIKASAARDAAK